MLDAVCTSVVVRWNRCSLHMVYCLSFNGYIHGVSTPGLSSRNQLGGSLYLEAFNNVVLSGDTSLEMSEKFTPRRARMIPVGEGGVCGVG